MKVSTDHITNKDQNTTQVFSNWTCYMFGSSPEAPGIRWIPLKGKEPNFFWRWMQYLFFGNRWVKK